MIYYDLVAQEYEAWHSTYDVARRVETLFQETPSLDGIFMLDAGGGTGIFSEAASRRGARVVTLDLSVEMLKIARTRRHCSIVCGDLLRIPFRRDTFDLVLSSEAIEHTPDPCASVREMARVLKPGGRLALSTPNRLWYPVLMLARLLRIRKFAGTENWVSWRALGKYAAGAGLFTEKRCGIHLFPFQLHFLHPILRWADRFGHRLGFLYINQVIWCLKR